MDLLTLNCGSATVKAARYRLGPDGGVPAEATRRVLVDAPEGVAAAVAGVLDELTDTTDGPVAIGHRVVHGGPGLTDPVLIDDDVLTELTELVPLAPIHQPPALEGIRGARSRFPTVPQVACFDTAFHHTMGEVERTLPLPRRLADAGVRRYGFHGLSYEYVVGHLGADTLGRAVVAHLGSGASLCAVRDGRSVSTTMGFTPTAGVVMGTRSGDVDPGALVHAMRTEGLDADGLEHLVDRESGLLGISGRSNDLRALTEAAGAGDHHAALAIDVFCRSVRHAVAALSTDLGGLDALVFTAGIGERSPLVRARVVEGLAHLGVTLDAAANAAGAAVISPPGAAVVVHVVPTDEEQIIARRTAALLPTHPTQALPADARPVDPTPVHTADLPPTPIRDRNIPAAAWVEAPEALLTSGDDIGRPLIAYKRRIGRWLLWRAGPATRADARYVAIDADDLARHHTFRLFPDGSGDGIGPSGARHTRFRAWKEDLLGSG